MVGGFYLLILFYHINQTHWCYVKEKESGCLCSAHVGSGVDSNDGVDDGGLITYGRWHVTAEFYNYELWLMPI